MATIVDVTTGGKYVLFLQPSRNSVMGREDRDPVVWFSGDPRDPVTQGKAQLQPVSHAYVRKNQTPQTGITGMTNGVKPSGFGTRPTRHWGSESNDCHADFCCNKADPPLL